MSADNFDYQLNDIARKLKELNLWFLNETKAKK